MNRVVDNTNRTPIRADLANVAPMFYPIVEHKRFGSLKAMCTRMGWPLEKIGQFVRLEQINRSDYVVIDSLMLGDPGKKMCAVLMMQPGDAVILCCGLFAEASEDLAEVEALTKEFAEHAEFRGKLVAIGEFRPNQKGAMQ